MRGCHCARNVIAVQWSAQALSTILCSAQLLRLHPPDSGSFLTPHKPTPRSRNFYGRPPDGLFLAFGTEEPGGDADEGDHDDGDDEGPAGCLC